MFNEITDFIDFASFNHHHVPFGQPSKKFEYKIESFDFSNCTSRPYSH
jgi:hypothetical protein